jgi:hypothetical protein
MFILNLKTFTSLVGTFLGSELLQDALFRSLKEYIPDTGLSLYFY